MNSSQELPHQTEAERRRETLALWIALGSILAGTGIVLGWWIEHTRPENLGWLWVQIGGIASVPGKYVIFSGLAPRSPMDPTGLAALCVPVDAFVACCLALFLGPLQRLPWIGPWLQGIHLRAHSVLMEYPRLRRMAFVGVALFVFLPLPGTGAVGGMFAGQMVGLSRPMSVLAIAIGTALIAALFAGLASTLGAEGQRILESPGFYAGSLLVFAGFAWVGYRVAIRKLRQP
ncbi:MAG: small multi-drug export protein [Planctomycetes bacterium]|nr:small multi-drug export protein [Planctomycetota bacterium]